MDILSVRDIDAQLPPTDRLIADVSAMLLRVDARDIAVAVEDALRLAGEALGVDRCTLVDAADRAGDSDAVFQWSRDTLPPVEARADVEWLKTLAEQTTDARDVIVLERIPDDVPAEILRMLPRPDPSRATMTSAIVVRGGIAGARTAILAIGVTGGYREWRDVIVDRARLLAGLLGAALEGSRRERAAANADADLDRVPSRTLGGTAAPRQTIEGFDEIVGDSPALRSALALLQEVAATDATVLLLGETGTGKELFAKALHARSARRRFPIIAVNCAALAPTLIESELFGHERGAFTDAVQQRQGRFELAHQGTLFLDEIGDLPLELQAKLLRVLQEGEFERLGASRTRKVDVRIVAATHNDLRREVSNGGFREDLYYRLNVFPIRLPPLRERREDIPGLVWGTIRRRQGALNRAITHVPHAVMEALQRREWPGNIRQLENVVERALIHSPGDSLVLVPEDTEEGPRSEVEDTTSLSSIERTHIEKVLRECAWRINGVGNAAERLGLHPNTLRFRMQKLGIVRARAVTPPPSREEPARSL